VEHYCKCPEGGTLKWFNRRFHRFRYEQACEWGQGINDQYFPTIWQHFLHGGNPRDLVDPVYCIKPALPDDPFPFDFHYDKDPTYVDLVVAKAGCASAKDLLDDFDLSLCKASWDGKNFHIPDPHYAFTGRSKLEPNRKRLMEAYRRFYISEEGTPDIIYGIEEERMRRVRYAVDRLERFSGFNFTVPPGEVEEIRQEAQDFALHNFIFKLFDRLKKYQSRGIEVEDAPETSNFFIRGFCDDEMPVGASHLFMGLNLL